MVTDFGEAPVRLGREYRDMGARDGTCHALYTTGRWWAQTAHSWLVHIAQLAIPPDIAIV